MRKFTKPDLPREHERWFWQGIRAGLSVDEAAVSAGASRSWGEGHLRQVGRGGPYEAALSRPDSVTAGPRSAKRSCGSGQRPGRSCHCTRHRPCSIDGESRARTSRRGARIPGGIARTHADDGRRGRRGAGPASNLRPCREVQDRLERDESPEQIAGRLKIDSPDEPEMWVRPKRSTSRSTSRPAETRARAAADLRTGRSMRKPRRTPGHRRTWIPDMATISDRPAEVEDRADSR